MRLLGIVHVKGFPQPSRCPEGLTKLSRQAKLRALSFPTTWPLGSEHDVFRFWEVDAVSVLKMVLLALRIGSEGRHGIIPSHRFQVLVSGAKTSDQDTRPAFLAAHKWTRNGWEPLATRCLARECAVAQKGGEGDAVWNLDEASDSFSLTCQNTKLPRGVVSKHLRIVVWVGSLYKHKYLQ